MPFQTQRKSNRNLVLAANKQAAPSGLFADAAFVRRQEFDGTSVPDLTVMRRDNQKMAGKGTQFGTSSIITGWDSKFPFKADADDWLLGWALAFVFGSDVVTGVAAPYLHTFSFDQSTDDCPLTNVYFDDSTATKYKLQDMAVSDLTITIPKSGLISLDFTMVGTGRWTDGALANLPVPPATFRYLLGSDAIFSLGLAGVALTPFDGRHQSTTIKIATGATKYSASGGGLFGIKVIRGSLSFSISTNVAVSEVDDVRTLLTNDTMAAMSFAVNSGAQATLNIGVPNFKLKANKLGFDGEMEVWNFTADQTTVLAVAGAAPINVTLANSVPSYLTAI